jgi:hypothetical protein
VVARVPDGFVIELAYGPDVDWYRNITAAGGCVVVYRAVEYQVDRIESCSTADGLAAFGFPRSLVLRLLRRREFRRLHVAEAPAPPSDTGQPALARSQPQDQKRRRRSPKPARDPSLQPP